MFLALEKLGYQKMRQKGSHVIIWNQESQSDLTKKLTLYYWKMRYSIIICIALFIYMGLGSVSFARNCGFDKISNENLLKIFFIETSYPSDFAAAVSISGLHADCAFSEVLQRENLDILVRLIPTLNNCNEKIILANGRFSDLVLYNFNRKTGKAIGNLKDMGKCRKSRLLFEAAFGSDFYEKIINKNLKDKDVGIGRIKKLINKNIFEINKNYSIAQPYNWGSEFRWKTRYSHGLIPLWIPKKTLFK